METDVIDPMLSYLRAPAVMRAEVFNVPSVVIVVLPGAAYHICMEVCGEIERMMSSSSMAPEAIVVELLEKVPARPETYRVPNPRCAHLCHVPPALLLAP